MLPDLYNSASMTRDFSHADTEAFFSYQKKVIKDTVWMKPAGIPSDTLLWESRDFSHERF